MQHLHWITVLTLAIYSVTMYRLPFSSTITPSSCTRLLCRNCLYATTNSLNNKSLFCCTFVLYSCLGDWWSIIRRRRTSWLKPLRRRPAPWRHVWYTSLLLFGLCTLQPSHLRAITRRFYNPSTTTVGKNQSQKNRKK